jgi:phage/plasmid primase-like uncharacterized protein
LPEGEVFEHGGLRCTVETWRSAVSGDTWLTGHVDLPAEHPLHGYDFANSASTDSGIVVPRAISLSERTEAGAWRVGLDSASQPDVVRAEFIGHVRELAAQLADCATQQAAASSEEVFFEHAGLRCSVSREPREEAAYIVGHIELPRGHPDSGKDWGHFTGWFSGSAYPHVAMRASGECRVSFDLADVSPASGHPDAHELPLRELFRQDRALRDHVVDAVKVAAAQLAGRAGQQDEVTMHALPARPVSLARHWLAVPYEERAEANARGAAWDREAKCWYAPSGADLEKLARWEPGPATDHAPALGARDEFAEVLRDLGCQLSGDHPIMDGRPHRIRTQGDRASEKAGFYVAALTGVPSGYAVDNRTGETITWRAKGFHLTSAERAQARAEALRAQEERDRERERMHARTAEFLAQRLEEFLVMKTPTPYLAAKGVQPSAGAFTDREGRLTVVPGYDVTGKLWTLQYIQPDGSKRFSRNARQAGCCHPVGGWSAVAQAPLLILAEGYSTAATIAQVLGRPTVACFNASNLVAVADGLRARFPSKSILIAADDDRKLALERGKNPGLEYARKAAAAVDGGVVKPVFAVGDEASTDFNDLARSSLGTDAVKQQLEAAITALKKERDHAKQRAYSARPSLRGERSHGRHL